TTTHLTGLQVWSSMLSARRRRLSSSSRTGVTAAYRSISLRERPDPGQGLPTRSAGSPDSAPSAVGGGSPNGGGASPAIVLSARRDAARRERPYSLRPGTAARIPYPSPSAPTNSARCSPE